MAAAALGTDPWQRTPDFPGKFPRPDPGVAGEKGVYQQRAAAMCSHQGLRDSRINPKET